MMNTSAIWDEYRDSLVEMYLDAIAFGKTSIGLEVPEVPEFNCDCIKHTRKMHIYTLSSNTLSFTTSFITHLAKIFIYRAQLYDNILLLLPSGTTLPNVAVHFALFELMHAEKACGYMSSSGFTRMLNY